MKPEPVEPMWFAPRDNFTAYCRSKCGEFITADTADGIKVLQERAAMLSTLQAIQQARANRLIRHANVVGRN